MSKRTLNLGKVVGRTPELRVEGKYVQIKYDNETEWRNIFMVPEGGGIKTVQTYHDLPADAKEGDVCLVLEDGYGEDDWRQLSMNDILVGRTPSQISFANTLEEIMSGCPFDRDSLLSGFVNGYCGFYDSENTAYECSLIHAKMDGMELTTFMIQCYKEDSDDMVAYGITDNGELFAMMMELEGVVFPSHVWVKFEMSYIPTEDGEDYEMSINVTELETAPVFDGVCGIEINDSISTEYSDSTVTKSFNLPEIKISECIYGLCLANYAPRIPADIYIFCEEKWEPMTSDEQMKEIHLGGSNRLSDVPGSEGEIAKVYPEIRFRENSYFSSQNCVAYINGIVGSYWENPYSVKTFGKFALANTVPQSVLEILNGKTIVIGGSPGYNWCSGYIACKDGIILVSNYGDKGFIYTNTGNTTFDSSVFEGVNIYDEYLFSLPTAGWYAFKNGLIIKCDSSNISIGEMLFAGYLTDETPERVFLLDGITTQIPSELSRENGVSLDGLLGYCQTTDSFDGLSYRMWDYQGLYYAKYSTSLGWNIYDVEAENRKLSNSHSHDNKGSLDKITYDFIRQANEANEKAHTHGNLEYLNSLREIDYSRARIVGDHLVFRTPSEYLSSFNEACANPPKFEETTPGNGTPILYWDRDAPDNYTLSYGKIYYDWFIANPYIYDVMNDIIDVSKFKSNWWEKLHKGCAHLTGSKSYEITVDKSELSINEMFKGCSSLSEASLNLKTYENGGGQAKVFLTSTFENCSNLTRVEVIAKNTGSGYLEYVFNNTFNGASSLEEVTLTDTDSNGYYNVKIAKQIHLQSCKNLTVNSILRVAKSLEYSKYPSGVTQRTAVCIGTENIEKLSVQQLYSIAASGKVVLM